MPLSRSASVADIHYRVEPTDLNAHLFTVTLTVQRPAASQELSLPVWIPGSYLVREFSKNLQVLAARQGQRALQPAQLDKHRWQVQCTERKPLVLTYQVCAYDSSVRTAWLDTSRLFQRHQSVPARA